MTARELVPLRHMALAVALGEHARQVRELRPNWHPRIAEYWRNLDPPLDIAGMKNPPPWCAVFVQFVYDLAAAKFGVTNPLNDVPLEAYVQSYVDLALKRGWVIAAEQADAGDLVCYSFGGRRFDHIGLLIVPPVGGRFETVEGNTPGTADGDQRGAGRGLDGVHRKVRRMTVGRPIFIRPVTASVKARAA